MKKLFLVLVLILALLIGCSGTLTMPNVGTGIIYLKGASGLSSATLISDQQISTIDGLNITEVKYEITNNTGGGGSIGFGITTYQTGDCSLVTPVYTVLITANTNIPMTSSIPELVVLQNQYYAVGQHRICIFYTQNDLNNLLHLNIQIFVTASKAYDYKVSGL